MKNNSKYFIKVFTGDVDCNGEKDNYNQIDCYNVGSDLEIAKKAMEEKASKYTADFGEFVEVQLLESDDIYEDGDIIDWVFVEHEYRKLEDAVVVYWYWETYFGYARKFVDVEVYYGNADESATIGIDGAFKKQMSVVAWPEELANIADEEKADYIINKINDMGKWINPDRIQNNVNDLF